MNYKKLQLALLSLLVTINLVPQIAAAQVQLPDELHPNYAPVVVIKGGSSADYGNYFFQLIAGSLLYLAGPIAIAMIAVGGLRYVVSHGDQTQMEGAKKTLQWAIIGLLVIIFSYAIIKGIISIILTETPAPGST